MKIEIWKPVVGYEGLYEVSNWGRVKSLKFGKELILKPCTNNCGYLHVVLSKNNKQKNFYVHRLVAQAFLPNPHNYPCVNHKDENPLNNNVENLEWCTYEYNNNFGTINERFALKKKKIVLQFTLEGKFIKEWPSAIDAEREGGFSSECIYNVCKGKQKTHYNFIWRYK